MVTTEKHRVIESNAALMLKWIRERGGVAIWGCLDLSNCGQTWSTPISDSEGNAATKPHWSATDTPIRIITNAVDILVDTPREVKRFHVAIRRGSQGLSLKVTDGGTRRIRAAVDKAGPEAWHEFDYGSQEAVILVPGATMSLDEWAKKYGE